MGAWLLANVETVLTVLGTVLGVAGAVLAGWMRLSLQPLLYEQQRLSTLLEESQKRLADLQTFRAELRLPDCDTQHERYLASLNTVEARLRMEAQQVQAGLSLDMLRQITQVAEENRRFREETGRQLQNETRDWSRLLVTEDGVQRAIYEGLQKLRDKEITDIFNRLLALERGKHNA
jgi:hypothetical protein